ncbi:hypothetical protein RN001_008251 [Aquatica leii]|uniref:Inter-alpha-trypsin inhibitor heavy chain H4-like n=1 Tax=Aquatica leii TaxID=1421715 RepID=A0AAN7P403_9COLE|nr:hypothetical protein RN001_008251 [Aquatica leii]
MKKLVFILGAILIAPILSIPMNGHHSLVVRSAESSEAKESDKEASGNDKAPSVPQIYQMTIKSKISNRFAHTDVTSKVRNFANKPQEAVFSIILPDSAFISGFVMEVDGKNYTAYVKEKEEAKRTYDEAVSSGLSAAHVAVSARDSNRFTVNVNIEPQKKAAFYLRYEQLLNRLGGRYEQVINIHPGQPVKDLNVEVLIAESRKIVNLKAPPLRSGNEIGVENSELDPRADIEITNDTTATIQFNPNIERQKQLAHILGTKEDDGLAGQFVVQYDVERDPQGGEVLVQDGYFVHFFAPTDLKPLPKQVVFILDTSGSMWGQKIEQLKQAMIKILEQLNEHDTFNLVEFNSNTKVWDINNHSASIWFPRSNRWYYSDDDQTFLTLENATFPRAYPANADNIQKAKKAVEELKSDGSTNMYTALEVGLHLVEIEVLDKKSDIKRQPIVIFLTDGDPTDLSTEAITTKTSEFNSGPRKSPIFALSFGAGAGKTFLERLALRNSGFSRHIYEAADASLQLQDFYKQISSPLLSDVKFKYEPSVTSLTKTEFPIHFGGSEIIIAGLCGRIMPMPIVDGIGKLGKISLKPMITNSISNIERLWAYLTISQLLEKKESSDDEKKVTEKKALDLALKYSFVTPVSSLVVVKPNDTKPVNTVEATEADYSSDRIIGGIGYGASSSQSFPAGGPLAYYPQMAPPRFASAGGLVGGLAGGQGIALSSYPINAINTRHKIAATYRPPAPALSTTTRPSTTRTPLDVLFENLPWLRNILTDGFVKVPSGTYKLGLNETISDSVICAKTPDNQEGHCSLLHQCPMVHSMLQSQTDFFDHFCVLRNEFAGVCCPNSS